MNQFPNQITKFLHKSPYFGHYEYAIFGNIEIKLSRVLSKSNRNSQLILVFFISKWSAHITKSHKNYINANIKLITIYVPLRPSIFLVKNIS